MAIKLYDKIEVQLAPTKEEKDGTYAVDESKFTEEYYSIISLILYKTFKKQKYKSFKKSKNVKIKL